MGRWFLTRSFDQIVTSLQTGLREHQRPGGTEQTLHRVDEQKTRVSAPGFAVVTHVLLQHVDEGGVKLAARMMV